VAFTPIGAMFLTVLSLNFAGDRLPRAGLAHDADRVAGLKVEGHTVHSPDKTLLSAEPDPKVGNGQ